MQAFYFYPHVAKVPNSDIISFYLLSEYVIVADLFKSFPKDLSS